MSDMDKWTSVILGAIERMQNKQDETLTTLTRLDSATSSLEKRVESEVTRIISKVANVKQECSNLKIAQNNSSVEHSRMNTLLDEHIKGVRLAEKRLEKLEEERLPLLEKDYQERIIIAKNEIKQDGTITVKAKKWAALIGIPTAIFAFIGAAVGTITKLFGFW